MPYIKQSWRLKQGLRWVSRPICFFGKHHWFYSTVLKKPIQCAVCGKKTEHWKPDLL
jgi:hypothetical protein